jgi:hypothetical protein
MLALLFVHPADACLTAPPDEFELVPDPLDVTPPTSPVLGEVEVTRARGARLMVISSCDDLGSVVIPALRPAGDPDRNDDVGYYVDVVDGEAPFDPFTGGPIAGPRLSFGWIDDRRGEPLAFTLSLTPVDRAGNEGEPVTVVVEDRGCGCGVAGGSPLGAATAAAWLLTRRTRRPAAQ